MPLFEVVTVAVNVRSAGFIRNRSTQFPGRLIASVLFAVGEMMLEAIKERQAAGIANAKAKGVYDTNGNRQRGYRKAKDKVLKLLKKATAPAQLPAF